MLPTRTEPVLSQSYRFTESRVSTRTHGGGPRTRTSDGHVSEEEPPGDERLAGVARRLVHDVEVGRVEAEGRGGQAVRHQVHPEQLHRDQRLRHAERRRQEDAHHLRRGAAQSALRYTRDNLLETY